MNKMTQSQLQERIDAIHASEKTLIDSMTEGRHFYVQTNMMVPRRILSKGGAEYLAKLFNWKVVLSKPHFTRIAAHKGGANLQVYIEAQVVDKKSQILAYGGGARSLTQDDSLNKALKMAREAAFVDTVLRASGLSSYFDQQDVIEHQFDDEPRGQNQATTPASQLLDIVVSSSPEGPKVEEALPTVEQIKKAQTMVNSTVSHQPQHNHLDKDHETDFVMI